MKNLLAKINVLPAKALVLLIKIYQRTLSPDHGLFKAKYPYGFCRHYPSCSEYSLQSIEKFGAIKGGYLSVKRIVACNPFTAPKIDQVPNNF
ncbi:MAG: membrane protein insertion efficiency factor YidD [Patescibacteria group bacterium]